MSVAAEIVKKKAEVTKENRIKDKAEVLSPLASAAPASPAGKKAIVTAAGELKDVKKSAEETLLSRAVRLATKPVTRAPIKHPTLKAAAGSKDLKIKADKRGSKKFDTLDVNGLYKEINKLASVFMKVEARFEKEPTLKILNDAMQANKIVKEMSISATKYAVLKESKIPETLIDLEAALKALNALLRITNPDIPLNTIPKPKMVLPPANMPVGKPKIVPDTEPNASKLNEEAQKRHSEASKKYYISKQRHDEYLEKLSAYKLYESVYVNKDNKIIRWFVENAPRLEREYNIWTTRKNAIEIRIKELWDGLVKADTSALIKKAKEEDNEIEAIIATSFGKNGNEQLELAKKAAAAAKLAFDISEKAELEAKTALKAAADKLKIARSTTMTDGSDMIFNQVREQYTLAETKLNTIKNAAAEVTKQLAMVKMAKDAATKEPERLAAVERARIEKEAAEAKAAAAVKEAAAKKAKDEAEIAAAALVVKKKADDEAAVRLKKAAEDAAAIAAKKKADADAAAKKAKDEAEIAAAAIAAKKKADDDAAARLKRAAEDAAAAIAAKKKSDEDAAIAKAKKLADDAAAQKPATRKSRR